MCWSRQYRGPAFIRRPSTSIETRELQSSEIVEVSELCACEELAPFALGISNDWPTRLAGVAYQYIVAMPSHHDACTAVTRA
jgi:hypothetical protein